LYRQLRAQRLDVEGATDALEPSDGAPTTPAFGFHRGNITTVCEDLKRRTQSDLAVVCCSN
jgi:hypothetical protein